mmetsp:Transcript_17418/g.54143  ORF Transcript_17418/g.54143 Transcript_17418/m.54143 type:complete len:280 (+) Transcript_17418:66-905(+)
MLLAPLLAVSVAASNPRVAGVRAGRLQQGKVIVSPSVAKCDLLNLGRECREAVDGGAEWLHFSVQDGRMVPKVSFGSPIVSALRAELPNTVFDVKLGCMEPERRVSEFAKAGADIMSVHPEATVQLGAVLNEINKADCAPGVILNPATPVSAVEHVLDLVDVVVVMLVNPGWGGPTYVDEACRKIQALREACTRKGVNPWIEVDGGVSASTVPQLLASGANVLVAGGSVFSARDKEAAIAELKGASGHPNRQQSHASSRPHHDPQQAQQHLSSSDRDPT